MICKIPDDKPWCYLHCGILETGVEHFTLESGELKSTYYDKNGNLVQPSCRDYEGVPCIDKCNITGVYSYGGKVNLATKPELKEVHYVKREGESTECTIDIKPEADLNSDGIMKGYLLLCLPCADNNCTDEVNINKILLNKNFKQLSLCEYKIVDDPCPEVAQCKSDDPWRIDIAKQSVPVEVKNVKDDCLKVDKCPDTPPWGVSIDAQKIDVAVKNTEPVKVINDGNNCLVVDQCPTKTWKVQIEGDAPPPTGTQDVNIVGSVCLDMKNCPNTVLKVEQTTPVKVINDNNTVLNVNLTSSDTCVDIKNCPGNPLHVIAHDAGDGDSGCDFIGMIKMANKCVSTDGGTTFNTAEHVRFFKCDKTFEDVFYDIKGVEITGTITLSDDGQECC